MIKKHKLNSNWVHSPIRSLCSRCGLLGSYYTFMEENLAPPKKPCFDMSTWHKGHCDLCGENTSVTEARDFYYPDFSCVPKRVMNKLINK